MKYLLSILFCILMLSQSFSLMANENLPNISPDFQMNDDSLVGVVDIKINSSKAYLKDNVDLIQDLEDGLLLLMLSEHFDLGLGKIIPTSKISNAYMRLYGKYFNNNKDFKLEHDTVIDTSIVVVNFSSAIENEYNRVVLSAFCEQLPLPGVLLDVVKRKSLKSDSSLIAMYYMLTEYNMGGCNENKALVEKLKAELALRMKDLVDNREKNVASRIIALTLLNYGSDIDLYNERYIKLLIESKQENGEWNTVNMNGVSPVKAAIFRLWGLCSLKERILNKE